MYKGLLKKMSSIRFSEKGVSLTRYYLTVGLLLLSAVVNVAYRSIDRQVFEKPRIEAFPREMGEWVHTVDIRMNQGVVDILQADGLVFREYRGPANLPVSLCLMYHINDRYGAHSPEVCYTSQGWTIEFEGERHTRHAVLPNSGFEVNQFTVEKGDQRRVVLYWFFGSDKRQTASRTRQMLANAAHRLFHTTSISGFVRVSSPMEPDSEAVSMEHVIDFADQVAVAIQPYLP